MVTFRASLYFVFVVFLQTISETHGFLRHLDAIRRKETWTRNSRGVMKRPLLTIRVHDNDEMDNVPSSCGLYRKFSDHAWKRLQESGMFQPATIPIELTFNQAPAKGMPNSVVQISASAMVPADGHENLVQYARVALLETISNDDDDNSNSNNKKIHTAGIQVLNFVVIPSSKTNLPVLGIDLVSLPGGRNLLLLDAQPMVQPNPYEDHWNEWYSQSVLDNKVFPWGGDFPEPVQKYVSKNALWTRLKPTSKDDDDYSFDPISVIQNNVWKVFTTHLDLYIDLLQSLDVQEAQGSNDQAGYLEYRRSTDPAKPMLNSLYGQEWTDQLLDQVLFPPNS